MESCSSCRRSGAPQACELCEAALCKGCVQFLDAGTFSFRAEVAPELRFSKYCPACFSEKVEPELEAYRETLDRAREVFFFFKTQRKPLPVLTRSKETIRVTDCADRDETILRLGFQAAERGFNAVLEGEVIATKVRDGAYQKSLWKGSGVPAQVDAEKLERHSK